MRAAWLNQNIKVASRENQNNELKNVKMFHAAEGTIREQQVQLHLNQVWKFILNIGIKVQNPPPQQKK